MLYMDSRASHGQSFFQKPHNIWMFLRVVHRERERKHILVRRALQYFSSLIASLRKLREIVRERERLVPSPLNYLHNVGRCFPNPSSVPRILKTFILHQKGTFDAYLYSIFPSFWSSVILAVGPYQGNLWPWTTSFFKLQFTVDHSLCSLYWRMAMDHFREN